VYLESVEDLTAKINYYYFKSKKFMLNTAGSTGFMEFLFPEKIEEYIKKNNLVFFKKLPNNDFYFK
jgi:hypothetical protein